MQIVAKLVGAVTLVGCIAAPLMYLGGKMSLDACKQTLLVSTLAWFAASYLVNFAGTDSDGSAQPETGS